MRYVTRAYKEEIFIITIFDRNNKQNASTT